MYRCLAAVPAATGSGPASRRTTPFRVFDALLATPAGGRAAPGHMNLTRKLAPARPTTMSENEVIAPPAAAPTVSFADFGLAPEILRALSDQGYVHPTPIQAQAIPIV